MHNAKLKVNRLLSFAYAFLFAYAIIQGEQTMESVKLNAKAKKVRGRNSQPNGENDGQGLGKAGGGSFVDGTEQQNRFTSGDCEENDSSDKADSERKEIDIGGDVGKILEEVLLLKQQFLDYVKSHQTRLEARLDESKKQEQQFLANAEALEKRLRVALAIEQTTEEESDITENS
ncbi:MAG: hypothetical protein RMZ69_21560 [Nostoc sp. ChiQUE01a]|nr:hypothetical protein [Nostoc sp. ChiQUE01a]